MSDKVNFRPDIRQSLFYEEVRTSRVCVALKTIWSYCNNIIIMSNLFTVGFDLVKYTNKYQLTKFC